MADVEKLTEIGTIEMVDNRTLVVTLYQRVTQEVRFAIRQDEGERNHVIEPLNLKQLRQLRRLLGQAENKMRKLIKKMATERRCPPGAKS